MFRQVCEPRRKYLRARTLGGTPFCSGGDLNPPLGFYFPLFSMSFARQFPSGWKTTESSGNKIVVFFCSQTTYKVFMCFGHCLPSTMIFRIPE